MNLEAQEGTVPLVTGARMRVIEAEAMARGQVSGARLMARAGGAVLAAFQARWPALAGRPGRAVVLAGPGNNGGDGFVIARLLAGRGWAVEVHLLGDPARLPPDAREAHALWAGLGAGLGAGLAAGLGAGLGAVLPATPDGLRTALGGADLAVDALFGIGLSRPVAGVAAGLCAALAEARCLRLAVDVPSGLCADTGHALGAAARADLTVTFHAAKPGHYLAEGPARCGALVVADIGLGAPGPEPQALVGPPGPWLMKGAGAQQTGGHKYSHGHVLVLAGPTGKGGAARLAARAALRVGAGLATLAPPPAALAENAAALEAVMLTPLPDEGAALAGLLGDPRLSALVMGPGLGHGRARALVPAALATCRPALLDADALSAFAEAPDALFAALHPGCVLTPHGGEFARLFPDLAALAGQDRLAAARAAAARAGAVVLLKGPDTVIAAPGGMAWIHAAAYGRAAPWLATAGAGDVLAGLIGGLMARGVAPAQAACAGAWLHVEAARRFGPGLIASDLPEALPGVLRDMLRAQQT